MDISLILRAVAALIFVVGLLTGAAFLLRRYGSLLKGFNLSRSATDRIRLVEMKMIDAKTKLVLINFDQSEHLLVINEGSVTIVPPNYTRT